MRAILTSRGVSFLAGGAVASALLLLAAADDGAARDPQLTNSIEQEPVLFWDTNGFSLGGPVHERLAVYSDGVVTYAYGSFGVEDGAACFTYVKPDVVDTLMADIRNSGAFHAGDEPMIISDTPLTTVTVFQAIGAGTSRARTFSFWSPTTPESQRLAQIVYDFKSQHIPPGLCNGSGW